jgi:hypothetical protein
MMMTELLELTATSILQALALGEIKEISEQDVHNLDNVVRKRGLPMFGAPGVNESLVSVFYPESKT